MDSWPVSALKTIPVMCENIGSALVFTLQVPKVVEAFLRIAEAAILTAFHKSVTREGLAFHIFDVPSQTLFFS